FAYIGAIVLVIIPNCDAADTIDGKGTSQKSGVTGIRFVIVAARRLMIRSETEIHVAAESELLSTTDSEWQLRAQNQSMILEECVEHAIGRCQAVKIVLTVQDQTVKLGQYVGQPGLDIETSKIKIVVLAVIKQLLPDIHHSIQVTRQSRLIIKRGHWCGDHVAFQIVRRQGNVGRIIDRNVK